MVCDESHHILALSECHGPSSILSRGEPRGPLEAASTPVPRKGEKVPAFEGERDQRERSSVRPALGHISGNGEVRGGSVAGREPCSGQPPSRLHSLGPSHELVPSGPCSCRRGWGVELCVVQRDGNGARPEATGSQRPLHGQGAAQMKARC